MPFALAAIVASAAALVGAQNCPADTQYGVVTITPTTVTYGDILTVNADFTCAKYLGNNPAYTDYYIEASSNDELPVLLTRRNAPGTTDSFTVAVPDANYFGNTSYSVVLENTFGPIDGLDGGIFYLVGRYETAIYFGSV